MTEAYILKTMGATAPRPVTSVLGKKEPIAHPQNCRQECPYGKGKSFCFPCMKQIVGAHKETQRA